MAIDEIKRILQQASLGIVKEFRVGNDSGIQLRLADGAIINIFDNGTVQFQGKHQEEMKSLILPALGKTVECAPRAGEALSNKVFVVYGHDVTARHQLNQNPSYKLRRFL